MTNKGKAEEEKEKIKKQDRNAYIIMVGMAVVIIVILIFGILQAFNSGNFAFVPYSVVIMGIVSFFTVLYVSRALSNSEHEMRKAITVAIMVVYLGLLPTLAFQGILQFQVTGNATAAADVAIINQTANQTVLQFTPKDISLSETVVNNFTTLVAAVLLFYFGAGAFESYVKAINGSSSTNNSSQQKEDEAVDPLTTEKETKIIKYDSKGNCVEKTVTTERTKKIE